MKFYLSLPSSAYDTRHATVEEAMAEAKTNAARYTEDFTVLEINLIGVYECSSPVWIPTAGFAEMQTPATPPPTKRTKPSNDDEVPF